ncbi:MAG: hypothetical protein C4290_02165 [Chloroflexota bacterium]
MQSALGLLALIQPRPTMRVIDLGCGSGEITALPAQRLPGTSVEGIDTATAMLARSARCRCAGHVPHRRYRRPTRLPNVQRGLLQRSPAVGRDHGFYAHVCFETIYEH